ncbi:glycosyltransferase [Cellulomonas sp.]|uniref:glycosyltransferase n=1 Tax=Cellulomonas sp. TaxID=40001 RepID=UPI0028118966|nr:glycosyltransferase [Cellulomonas sp.]
MTALTERIGTSVRRSLRRRSEEVDRRDRQPPALRTGPGRHEPRVLYLAPHLGAPSGGVRVLYRHVDVLRALGVDASVLHARPGFRCTWFENDTPVTYPDEVVLGPDDVLVVPEYYGPGLHTIPADLRTVVFNQGAYHTFDGIPLDAEPGAPYAALGRLEMLMAVSQDSVDLLHLAFPDLPVRRCRPVVDAAVFHPGDGPRARRIAFVDRNRVAERHQLLHILRARGVDREILPIAGRSEQEVAEIMRGSDLFLSFSERDGFGLPPAEAMASGCYVVGYTGGGGDEFFDPASSTPVRSLREFAAGVLEAVAWPEAERRRRGAAASERVLGRYHEAGLREDLQAAFEPLLARVG